MKIAFFQKNFHPNSVGIFQGLLEHGHEVLNVVQYLTGSKSGNTSVGVTTVELPYGRVSSWAFFGKKKLLDRRGLPNVRRLVRLLRDFRPEVVIVKEIRGVSLAVIAVARFLGVIPVLFSDKPKTAKKSPLLAVLGGLVLPRRKFHMGHFGSVGHFFPLGWALGESLLLTYPVRPNPQGPKPPVDGAFEPVRIVTVSSLSNRRKLLTMLTEAVIASGLAHRVTVTYIGLGDESSHFYKEIREREAAAGLAPSAFLFNLPHHEVLLRLREFDIFVLPARNELFGVVVPEAMAQGLPVVCSTTTGARVCFEDGISGLTFASGSLEGLTEQLARLIEDTKLRGDMGRAAHERVTKHLAPDVWVRRLESLVEQ